jgi:hypothetical protein
MPYVKKKIDVAKPVGVDLRSASVQDFETKPVLVGFATRAILEKTDEEGLPFVLPESMGKEYHEFRKALALFAAKGWKPHMEIDFAGAGGHYLIFIREKV